MKCSFCGIEGKQFIGMLMNGEPKTICRECIKKGKATPEKRPVHTNPAAIPCK